jgi:hypothetical protein
LLKVALNTITLSPTLYWYMIWVWLFARKWYDLPRSRLTRQL